MTLKDKFLKASVIEGVVDNSEVIAATNVMIAEEFAIGFVKWLNGEYSYHHGSGEYYDENTWYKLEELLEIYKKEKNL